MNFNGRFESRFGTDAGDYNANPQYTSNIAVIPCSSELDERLDMGA